MTATFCYIPKTGRKQSMKANETKLQVILEGVKQYVIPLFQRQYSWGQAQWKMLLDDLLEIYEDNSPRDHFMGSIVTMPFQSRPEGVAKYTVIDGQQRLTTLYIILCVLRDIAKESKQRLSSQIEEYYLFNKYSDGNDFYKLLPTKDDRVSFFDVMSNNKNNKTNQVINAYTYFNKQFIIKKIEIDKMLKVICSNLSLVSITLENDDNPYRIFESLNATGLPLAESDLIRNYFFMRIYTDEQEMFYNNLWRPMQNSFDKFDKENEKGKTFSSFIRHFLMKDGSQIKEREVYASLKEIVDLKSDDEIVLYLTDIYNYSKHYLKLLNPSNEPNSKIKDQLIRLNRLDISTSFCFILNIYQLYDTKKITSEELLKILKIVENFVIRRFICGVPSNQLNKVFPPLFKTLDKENLIDSLKSQLYSKNYPKNSRFKNSFSTVALYGKGKDDKVKLILESLETSYAIKKQFLLKT